MLATSEFLTHLPKCEHHVHLEGTLEPSLLFQLAHRNNIQLPDDFPKSVEALQYRYQNFKDLQDFLNLYYVGMSVLITEQDFEDLAWAYLEKSSKQGLKHVEAFFDPQGHVDRGIDLELVIGGFRKALVRAEKELGMSTKLIMCLLRHLPPSEGLATIKSFAPYYKKGWIHGMGLDSSEVEFPPELFTSCYQYARSSLPKEVHYTAHAGEEAGSDYVRRSLKCLGISRIDHGVHSADDPELMKQLAERDIMLTVCPLSNKRLQVVDDVSQVPIRKFLEYGVPFSINSDDPAYFGGYILDNYLAVQEAFKLNVDEWIKIAKNSVRGSWVSEKRKKDLYRMIDECERAYSTVE
ncbi:DEKNAAC103277 [Brettanomyces naardenensis]|uniref:Adenine deaminase n=1 Tax=Brettanomyces naardenensis TaxID=13370 RepID=A0A448YN21_BRENA|nr:DEKNAAC103277 [Brettanomyces naardenensis]